jgi:hypothetical protein
MSLWSRSAKLLLSCACLAVPTQALADDTPLTVGGFVDGQLQASSEADMQHGFLVNDGAIYISKSAGGASFLVDLPLRLAQSALPNVEVGTLKPQAYVAYQHSNGFRWKLGQFDTSYGLESNDSVAVAFTRQGNVYNFTDPFVHTGLQLGYDVSSRVGINLLLGSPADTGTLGASKRLQSGLQVAVTGDTRFAVGGLVTAYPGLDDFGLYADITAGITSGKLAVDIEANWQKRPLDTTPTGAKVKDGIAALVQAIYSATDKVSAGIRAEYITNISRRDPRAPVLSGYIKSQVLVFVGPQYRITPDLQLKADYSLQMDDNYVGGSDTIHGAQAAAVYRF